MKVSKEAIKRKLHGKKKIPQKKSGKVHGYYNVLNQIASGEKISNGAAAKILAKSGDYPGGKKVKGKK